MKTARPKSRAAGYWGTATVMLALQLIVFATASLQAQQVDVDSRRKAVQKVMPTYPAIARELKLAGTVKMAVRVAPNGRVLSAQVIGGHPAFVQVALEAVRQWRYEASPEQTEEMAVINFTP